MKKTSRLVGLFASSVLVAPLAGCGDPPDEVEVCFDADNNLRCDHDDEFIRTDDYLVINGKKTRVYIDDDDFLEGLGYDSTGSYGG